MLFPPDAQTVATRFAPYFEELHEFFAGHGMHFGSPEDLVQLSRRLNDPGAFPRELSSMVRSIILREGGHMPRAELLMLVAVSIGGARIAESAQDLQEAMSHLMDFVTAVIRNPRNEPAWMSSEKQASRPGDGASSSVRLPAEPAVPEGSQPAGPPHLLPANDLLQHQPGSAPTPDNDLDADPGRSARSVYSRFATTKTTTIEDAVPDAPAQPPPVRDQIMPVPRAKSTASKGRKIAGAVTFLLVVGAGLAAWRAASRDMPAQIHPQSTPSAPAEFIKSGQATNAQITITPTAHMSGQVPQATKPIAVTEPDDRPGSHPSPVAPVPSTTPAASQVPASGGGASFQESPPNAQAEAAAGETNERVRSRRSAKGQQQWLNVSSGLMAGNLISAPPPEYPKLASFAHIQGPVLMQAVISKTGIVENLHVIRGHRLLRGAAASAVRKWRYRPYLVNGHAVEVATIVSVDFKLHH